MAQPPRKDQLKRETQARSKKGKRKAREGEEKKRKESERKKKRTQKKRKIGKGGGGNKRGLYFSISVLTSLGYFSLCFEEKKNKRGRIEQRKRANEVAKEGGGNKAKENKFSTPLHRQVFVDLPKH